MGFLDGLFGKKQDYPPLEESSPAASRIGQMKEPLEKLTSEFSDDIEIVPTEQVAYAFIGKPPKKFGVAWVEASGKINNFKTLVDEKGLSMPSLERLSNELKDAYIRSENESRYATTIADRKVVVTPSEAMASDIKKIIDEFAK
ncbi:MAG: hypothetical protein R3231_09625 [bacterium]|nr:hypothetical protein [bacterium]